jgi:hypothetical protein
MDEELIKKIPLQNCTTKELEETLKTLSEGMKQLTAAIGTLGYYMQSSDIVPEIAELTVTVPLPYSDVAFICYQYEGIGDYKEFINQYKERGELDKCLEDMCSAIRDLKIRKLSVDIDNQEKDGRCWKGVQK